MVGRYRKRTGHKRYNTCSRNIRTRRGKNADGRNIYMDKPQRHEDINPVKAAQGRVQWWPFVVRVINRWAP